MILCVQIVTGILLTFSYVAFIGRFEVVLNLEVDVFWGYLLRLVHLNFASLFFIRVYFHLFRGLWCNSYFKLQAWNSGNTILILLIISAFLGYVLPWGQISFWGATVITNLFSALPIIGSSLVVWIWGGFRVSSPTLRFFFSLHYLLPLVILTVVIFHLIVLHESLSNSLLLSNDQGSIVVSFRDYLLPKDVINATVLISRLVLMIMFPVMLADSENYILANPLLSPLHIKPEWYFLFAYAILRSVPNKLGGVIALCLRVVVFYLLPFKVLLQQMSKFCKIVLMFWILIAVFLTFLGRQSVEDPFVILTMLYRLLYFLLLMLHILTTLKVVSRCIY